MTHRGAHPVQSVFVDGVAEPHLAVERVLLVIAHQIDQTLKLCRAAQHEETTLLLDATVFDLSLRPSPRKTTITNKKRTDATFLSGVLVNS